MCTDNRDYLLEMTQNLWNSVDTWTCVLWAYKNAPDYVQKQLAMDIDVLFGEFDQDDKHWAASRIINYVKEHAPR